VVDWKKEFCWGRLIRFTLTVCVSFSLGFTSNKIYQTYSLPVPEVSDPRFIPDPEAEGVYMRITKAEYDSLMILGKLEEKEDGPNIDRKRGGRRK
jgi:hypothetical protein